MSTGSHQLPLPVGARVSPASRRVVSERWSAPDPATLVLDPWAAPVGLAVALDAPAPWVAPPAHTRIRWMASPAALHPTPALFRSTSSPAEPTKVADVEPTKVADVEESTERALAALRTIVAPVEPAPARPAFPAPDPAERIETPSGSAWSQIRWRVVAIASAAGAAVGAGATLLITSF